MIFDLSSLFPEDVDLSLLEELFTHDEIDHVIAHLSRNVALS